MWVGVRELQERCEGVEAVGGQWPPKGMEVLNAWEFPLLNTLILLCSGCTVTWAPATAGAARSAATAALPARHDLRIRTPAPP